MLINHTNKVKKKKKKNGKRTPKSLFLTVGVLSPRKTVLSLRYQHIGQKQGNNLKLINAQSRNTFSKNLIGNTFVSFYDPVSFRSC